MVKRAAAVLVLATISVVAFLISVSLWGDSNREVASSGRVAEAGDDGGAEWQELGRADAGSAPTRQLVPGVSSERPGEGKLTVEVVHAGTGLTMGGVRVSVWHRNIESGEAPREGLTTNEGRMRISVRPGHYEIVALDASETVEVVDGQDSLVVLSVLDKREPGPVVNISVVDMSGRGLGGAHVWVVSGVQFSADDMVPLGVTDARGELRVMVPRGKLTATLAGMVAKNWVMPVHVEEGEPYAVVVMDYAETSLEVRVESSLTQAPIENAEVCIWVKGALRYGPLSELLDSSQFLVSSTGTDGLAEFDLGISSGEAYVYAVCPGFRFTESRVDVSDPHGALLRMEPASPVRVHVIEKSGGGVGGALVRYFLVGKSQRAWRRERTGADGWVSLPVAVDDISHIEVSCDGWEEQQVAMKDVVSAGGRVIMEPSATMKFKFVNERGEPWQGVRLRFANYGEVYPVYRYPRRSGAEELVVDLEKNGEWEVQVASATRALWARGLTEPKSLGRPWRADVIKMNSALTPNGSIFAGVDAWEAVTQGGSGATRVFRVVLDAGVNSWTQTLRTGSEVLILEGLLPIETRVKIGEPERQLPLLDETVEVRSGARLFIGEVGRSEGMSVIQVRCRGLDSGVVLLSSRPGGETVQIQIGESGVGEVVVPPGKYVVHVHGEGLIADYTEVEVGPGRRQVVPLDVRRGHGAVIQLEWPEVEDRIWSVEGRDGLGRCVLRTFARSSGGHSELSSVVVPEGVINIGCESAGLRLVGRGVMTPGGGTVRVALEREQ